jgi:hypothetical protein
MRAMAIQAPLANDNGVTFKLTRAFFVKLGARGAWERDSIEQGKLRIGWDSVPLSEIHARNWDAVMARAVRESKTLGVATRDTNALKDIVLSESDTVWITFYASRLWWCRLGPSPVEQDDVSKFRRVEGGWSDTDVRGAPLLTNALPGSLTKIQGFRGTICRVADVPLLRRVLRGERSPAAAAIEAAGSELAIAVEEGIRHLHWKDFEVLVDLLFRQSGWQRLTTVGETMKFTDLDLIDPLTGDRYQVQVKSTASSSDLAKYVEGFDSTHFRKLYLVVHSPLGELATDSSDPTVEIVPPSRLARMVVDLGLTQWLLTKLR